ncbi:hypothetical protein ACQP1O_43055 (plasmid) [Nocardia sp. CA-151230]|uniref:hypothetical protein n=1 Tax=Nocardia sp. CA-151230 TaxID=3239982 RepID=UPI003D89C2C4
MKLTVLIADAAQVDLAGKVHALGMGWDKTTTPTPPMTLIIFVDFEESPPTAPLTLDVLCLGPDGEVVKAGPDKREIKFRGHLQGDENALRALATINIGPMQLEPGRHVWNVSIVEEGLSTVVPFEAIPATS